MNEEQLQKAIDAVEALSEILGVTSDSICDALEQSGADAAKIDKIYQEIYE